MSKQFNHLNIPSHWQSYWTRFPEGHTILEALIQWVSQVDEMVDNQNKLSDTVSNYGTRLDQFIDQFEGNLSDEVKDTLGEWQASGFIDVVISEALQWQLDDYITTNEQDKLSITTQLAQTMNKTPNVIGALDYNLKGDGTDETAIFQQLLDENTGKTIVFPKFESELLLSQIILPSDIKLIFHPNSVIKIVSGLPDGEVWFDLTGQRNIEIVGNNSLFEMRKGEYTTGEHRHCFNLQNTENITFRNVTAKGSGGDGWYVGQRDSTIIDTNKNIKLIECVSDDNRRQGLSITTVDGFYAYRSEFNNTSGTFPAYGVDFEPNSAKSLLKNIVFDECSANNNTHGFGFFFPNLDSTSEPVDILLQNCKTSGNGFGISMRRMRQRTKGTIRVKNWLSVKEGWSSYMETDCRKGVVKEIELHSINANERDATSAEYGMGAPVFITRHEFSEGETTGYTVFRKLRIEDTRNPKKLRYNFSMRNTYVGEIIEGIEVYNPYFENDLDINIYQDNIGVYFEENPVKLRKRHFSSNTGGGYTNVQRQDLNKVLTNMGASANISFRLKDALPSDVYRFRVESNEMLTVQSHAGANIFGFSTNESIRSSSPGSYMVLKGREDGKFDIVEQVGAWERFTV